MKKLYYLLFISVLLVGFFLRIHNLTTWPRLGATFDEYAWTWQGINLIQKGVPISWSPHPQYKDTKEIIYQKTHFRIVTPYLEHPPLFGLVAGGTALINGVNGPYKLNLEKIRVLPLLLGVLSIVIIMIFTKDLYGRRVSIISGILYATIPTVAIGSRIVENENFFIPLFLLSIYFIQKYIKTKRFIFRNVGIGIACLLILAKIPWVAAAFSLFIIFLFLKRYRDASYVVIGTISSFIIYFAYGAYYNLELFLNLWKLQAARYDLGFNSIYALVQKPYLADRFYTDGWILIGLFTTVLLFQNIKKHLYVALPFLSYFLIFLAGIPDEAGHGWYRYPLYPFVVISIAIFIKEYYARNFFLTFLFIIGVGLNLFHQTWVQVFGFSFFFFRFILITFGLILLPPFLPRLGKLSVVISYFYLVIFVLLNIWSILLYNEQ